MNEGHIINYLGESVTKPFTLEVTAMQINGKFRMPIIIGMEIHHTISRPSSVEQTYMVAFMQSNIEPSL